MSILNLFPVALAALGLVLRWYQFAPAKRQNETPAAQVNAKKSIIKAAGLKQPNTESRVHVSAKAAIA